MSSIEEAREHVEHNKLVDTRILELRLKLQEEIELLESTKVEVDAVDERKVGLCDWFRSTKYYKEGMTDQDIIDRHDRLEREYL